MSHFTRLQLAITDKPTLFRLAEKRGWTIEDVQSYTSPYGQTVNDVTLIKDNSQQVKLILSNNGIPIIDQYYMGDDGLVLLQEYAREQILSNIPGGFLQEETYNENGDLLLKIAII